MLLIAGHDLIHWGFKALLAREPWVERLVLARGSSDARELARRYCPHVAVVDGDACTEPMDDLCGEIRAASPSTRTLLISNERVSARFVKAAGAAGAIPRSWSGRDIAGATRGVGLGLTVFVRDVETLPQLLSKRETEVLEMVAAGATNREIAARLCLSPHTVKDHTSALYRKVNARNRAEAIVRAQRLGLLD